MSGFSSWFSNDAPPSARIWLSLAPALVGVAYFVLGLIVFSIRTALYGVTEDQETKSRGATMLVGFYLRHFFFWLFGPWIRFTLWTGIPANWITGLSAIIGVASGFAVAVGSFALGGWLFIGSGILDAFDGRIARLRGESGPVGAAIDSILDRYVDTALLMGLAWYYRDSWVLFSALMALLGASIVPYVRARGEGLGIALRGGAMQRQERVVYLGTTVTLSPVFQAIYAPGESHPMYWLAVAGISFVALTSNVTGVTRIAALVRALGAKQQASRTSTHSARDGATSSRASAEAPRQLPRAS